MFYQNIVLIGIFAFILLFSQPCGMQLIHPAFRLLLSDLFYHNISLNWLMASAVILGDPFQLFVCSLKVFCFFSSSFILFPDTNSFSPNAKLKILSNSFKIKKFTQNLIIY